MRVVIVSVALILGLVWLPSPAVAGDFTGVPLVPPDADEELVTIQRVGASGQVVLYHTASAAKWGFWSVWNRRTGAVVRVGDGNEAAMSTDGRFVIYLEPLSLTSGTGTRVVVYDVSDGTRTTVNRRTDDGSVGGSYFFDISMISEPSGVKAFFHSGTSFSPDDTNTDWDAYEYDFKTGQTTFVTADSSGVALGTVAKISEDGNFALLGPDFASARRDLRTGDVLQLGTGTDQWDDPRCDWISRDGRYVACLKQVQLTWSAGTREAMQTILWDLDTDVKQVFAGEHRWSPDLLIRVELFQPSLGGDGSFFVYRDGEPVQQLPSTTLYVTNPIGGGGVLAADETSSVLSEVWYSDVGPFADSQFSVFKSDIGWLAASGLTKGCNPPTNDMFCPNNSVTRGQMAAFLHRALPDLLVIRPAIDFADDDESIFEADIEWLYAVGVTEGVSETTFNPNAAITRGQMAALLVRALKYTDNGGGNLFVDDDASQFRGDIDRLGASGVTRGCNPPTNDKFCPDGLVTRGQMAAFLYRALGG